MRMMALTSNDQWKAEMLSDSAAIMRSSSIDNDASSIMITSIMDKNDASVTIPS